MTFAQSLLMAVVEGLTEYLPISSTGHIILTSWLLGIHQDPFVKDFTVMVQFGAIMAVVVLFWRRFIVNFKLYPVVFVAFLPAAGIGLLVKNKIDALLGNIWIVALALLIGGILLVLTDHWVSRQKARKFKVEDIPLASAVKIGLFQCLAFIPGVSRAAATIWGGIYVGMSLETATLFSFYLAVPTLTGAGFLKLIKVWAVLTPEQIQIIAWGNIVSFLVGALAVKGFVHIVSTYGMRFFGYYRILLGVLVILALFFGEGLTFIS